MNYNIFSGPAQVEIQGEIALNFISLNESQAQFEVIGITQPKIRFVDHRAAVRRKMKEVLITDKVEQLAEYINCPANITIFPPENGEIVVRLEKTRSKKPRYMLWVAVGIKGDIPLYNYKRIEMQELEENIYSLFTLYKRPHTNKGSKI